MTFDASTIHGGDNVHFRVSVSDGLRSAESSAGPLTLLQRPEVSVPRTADAGESAVGISRPVSISVEASGTGVLRIEAISSDDSAFVPASSLPIQLVAGTTGDILVDFNPPTPGNHQASLTLTTNAPGNETVQVQLAGVGLDRNQGILDVPNVDEGLGFGDVNEGETGRIYFSLINRGELPVNASVSAGGEGFSLGPPAAALSRASAGQEAIALAANEQRDLEVRFAPIRTGDFAGTLRVTSDAANLASLDVPLSGRGVAASLNPVISAGGIVDAASFQAALARGGIASLFGSGLSPSIEIASTVPLPTSLNGVEVRVDGVPAPLFFASESQVNFQMPFEAPLSGSVNVVVRSGGLASSAEMAAVQPYAPAVFVNPGTGEPVITRHPGGELITADDPARPGDVLIIFVTGIGDVDNPPASGSATPASPIPTARVPPMVTVGGAESQVFFGGLAPFFVGLGQINIQLPDPLPGAAALRTGAAQGATLPLVIAFGESRSQAVNLPIAGVTVQPGRIDVGPVGLDFGDVNVGQSGNGTLTVRNVGAGALTVNSINTDNARFAVVSPPTPFTVPPGAQRMITLSFQPTAVGRVDASALIGSDDPLNPAVTIPLLGHGVGGSVAGSLSLSTASLAFGSVSLGQSADLPLTLSNTGGADLTVNTITSSDSQFSTVFAGSPSGTPFTLAAGAQLTISVRFQPGSAGTHNATLSVSSSDTASPIVNISLTGEGAGGGGIGGAPSITLNSNSVSYGGVTVGRTNELTLIVTNGGGGPLTVASIASSDPQFRAAAPETPFIVPVGGKQSVNVHFTPSSLGSHSGTLTFASNDPAQPDVEVAVSGNGVAGAHIQFSDSFDRPDASCSPAPADNAFGGGGRHGYLPLFILRGRPAGARLVSGALENPGMNYGGVQFSGDEQPCFGGEGENIGQDANIRVDLLVPGDSDGNITQAGPYFRTRSATPGSSILGGMSAGYWVQLHSTGQIKLKLLNPEATVAATRTPAAFDNTVMHRLEVSMRRDRLWVALDGVLQVFDQDDTRVISVPIPAVWERPPAVGENEGAAGIAFGAEDNPDQIGGQRADNLVVTDYESLTELPLQD